MRSWYSKGPKMYEFFHRAKFSSLETKNGQLDRFMAKKKVLEKTK